MIKRVQKDVIDLSLPYVGRRIGVIYINRSSLKHIVESIVNKVYNHKNEILGLDIIFSSDPSKDNSLAVCLECKDNSSIPVLLEGKKPVEISTTLSQDRILGIDSLRINKGVGDGIESLKKLANRPKMNISDFKVKKKKKVVRK